MRGYADPLARNRNIQFDNIIKWDYKGDGLEEYSSVVTASVRMSYINKSTSIKGKVITNCDWRYVLFSLALLDDEYNRRYN